MCHFKIINRTSNGFLLFCPKRNLYNVSFNNLTFNFDPSEMFSFISFLDKIDTNYWEKEYENSIYEKKIPIPTLQSNFIILLNRNELNELRILLDFKTLKQLLKSGEINYKIIYN
ncbi:DUF6686 family protein [Flavobacterium aquatile]|uniref:Uncharacterized protein n=1 Tax=Flavobacterium aquatile LMG 4008 = ATCC 11947 TaxID=1453498 RepID=A0A095V068_9FLAO|nr:DUF6686 family protein [Flavobacterium aquatile]KGD68220.1 hypothetical protein LG45_07965 [Flavobacterium aquatile LMG 4008 = ATCC 11947]OXA68846.1 hypothetical protein B0A61_03825 [Flavobacterium aquatile LMG 4008 = ATCC 11947]